MIPEDQFWWNWWVQIAVAIGTLGAVFVALFGDFLRAKMFKPDLTMKLENALGVATPVTLAAPDGKIRKEEGRIYHGRISNPKKWPLTTRVQVNLVHIEKPGPDDVWRPVWTGEVPMRWCLQEINPLTRVVGPSALFDICTIVKDKWLDICTLVVPNNLDAHQRSRGAVQMILTFQAQAAETTSDPFRIKISWDGKWEYGEAEMSKHLVIAHIKEGPLW